VDNTSEEDRDIIRKQLRKEPKGLLGVSARCRYGYPVVLMTRPLIIGENEQFEVFPTLYWLSCPRRVERVSRIESQGYIAKLEEELVSNPELQEEYREDENDYLEKQWGLLSEEEKNFVEKRGLRGALSRGIGGIESDKHIKCLHLHLAHQIAEANIIGRMVQDRFEIGDCHRGEIRCEELKDSDQLGD